MLNWDEYNKDEAAVVQQEVMTAKPVVQEAVAEVPEVKEGASSIEAGARAAQQLSHYKTQMQKKASKSWMLLAEEWKSIKKQ